MVGGGACGGTPGVFVRIRADVDHIAGRHPGAAFAIIAVLIYLREVDQGRLRWSYLVVPAATFASTLSRFGAPFMIAAGLVAVVVIAAPAVVRARNWRLVAESAALAVATALVVVAVICSPTPSPRRATRRPTPTAGSSDAMGSPLRQGC